MHKCSKIGRWERIQELWRRPGAEFGGTENIFVDQEVFSGKISIFRAKFFDDFFYHRPGFSDFPFFSQIFRIFTMLDFVLLLHFPHKKNTFFYSSYFRVHPTTLLLKILWGTNAWAVPPP